MKVINKDWLKKQPQRRKALSRYLNKKQTKYLNKDNMQLNNQKKERCDVDDECSMHKRRVKSGPINVLKSMGNTEKDLLSIRNVFRR